MKKKLGIILIFFVTIACVYSGFKTRERNGIVVTKIATNSENGLSYMLETNQNNIIMIDGGSTEDSYELEKLLIQKGGIVDRWFITVAHSENFGAMKKIIENGNIEIRNIYISFNEASWYEKNEIERYAETTEFLDLIYSEENIKKVYDVPLRYEMLIDNLYITVLNTKNPEIKGEYAGLNQSMVIKVNNTYKSMIFMGNIAFEAAEKFKDNNLDEINCDAVQISNNRVSDDIYKMMTPEYIFAPEKSNIKNILQIEDKNYISSNENMTIKIW